MPRSSSKSAKDKGVQTFMRRGMPFDLARRAEVLREVEGGQSQNVACKIAGVDRSTVRAWLDSGRSASPKHVEHAKFARAYDVAEAKGIKAAFEKVSKLATSDSRAAIALIQAMDERFGDRALRRERMRTENLRAHEDMLTARARRVIAEKLAEKAGKDDAESQIAFGLSMMLSDDALPADVRQAVARWAIARGIVLIERADLTSEPA